MPSLRGIELVLLAMESLPEIQAYRVEYERLQANQAILNRRQTVDACAKVLAIQYSNAMGCTPQDAWRLNAKYFMKQAKSMVRKLRHAQLSGSVPSFHM